jgi:hypothetical protein
LGLVLALTLLSLVGLPVYRRLLNIRYRRRLSERGASGPFPTTYEVTDGAFVYTIGGITKTATWAVVSEVFGVAGWWILMAQGQAFYVPRRAFARPSDERSFMQSILDHLGPEARVRSAAAAAMLARIA